MRGTGGPVFFCPHIATNSSGPPWPNRSAPMRLLATSACLAGRATCRVSGLEDSDGGCGPLGESLASSTYRVSSLVTQRVTRHRAFFCRDTQLLHVDSAWTGSDPQGGVDVTQSNRSGVVVSDPHITTGGKPLKRIDQPPRQDGR